MTYNVLKSWQGVCAETSWVASLGANNLSFDVDEGGFSEDNLLSICQRGFKTLIQLEAQEFLQPEQVVFDSRVTTITYSTDGVQFPKKFWFDTELALYADPTPGTYPVWQSLDHPGFLSGSGLSFTTVTGDWSQRIKTLAYDQVKREALDVLQHMFPDTTIQSLLTSIPAMERRSPLQRIIFQLTSIENPRANADRLYFAGEATSQKYLGYLHGAYDEGVNVAKTIVACIKDNECVELQHSEAAKEVEWSDGLFDQGWVTKPLVLRPWTAGDSHHRQ
ncbi:hypothetical protein DFS33DRAFT_1449110 [Desarmillaria ectypa]|nr:hypothetical protein DFS33DRAFT_1449110 [Desarmillaria ectypa]